MDMSDFQSWVNQQKKAAAALPPAQHLG
jgi:hypothetical protein